MTVGAAHEVMQEYQEGWHPLWKLAMEWDKTHEAGEAAATQSNVHKSHDMRRITGDVNEWVER